MVSVIAADPVIKIRDVAEGFRDNTNIDGTVFAYGGKLQVRPPYQREFIYDDKDSAAVIHTIYHKLPLSVIYWADNGDGTYEVIDGQQRIISFCNYITKPISVALDERVLSFNDLCSLGVEDRILDYPLMIYKCVGSSEDILDWFETINIAGKELKPQELRSATYHGSWVTDAKAYFVRRTSTIKQTSGKYLTGKQERQDYFETAIKWHLDYLGLQINDKNIRDYMSHRRKWENASELREYFQSVIQWVDKTFPTTDSGILKLMEGRPWGELYNKHGHRTDLNSDRLMKDVRRFMGYEEVQKTGIFEYLLTGEERYLEPREFDDNIKMVFYKKQRGICKGVNSRGNPVGCGKKFKYDEMEGDHIKPWIKGGLTRPENCQMLCVSCNAAKKAR